MKKINCLIYLLFITFTLNSQNGINDDKIIKEIANILVIEYDHGNEFNTPLENFILQLGKKTFIDSVRDWEKNYKSLDTIKINLHPQIKYMITVGDKNLTIEKSKRFRELFDNLTLLGYKNLQIYYLGVKDYLLNNSNPKITMALIEEAITEPQFYKAKIDLFAEEKEVKKEIKQMFKEDKIKYKLAFYSVAFDFLNGIREKIVARDMAKMLKKVNAKSARNKK